MGHSVPGCSFSIPVGNRERQRGRRPDPKPDGSQGGIYAGTTTGGTRQCGSPSRLGGVLETKSVRNGPTYSSRWRQRWRSQPSPGRGRSGRLQRKKLSESRSGKNTGRLGYSCSAVGECAAKALFSCPAIISQRLESRIISKEPQENTEEESKII